jgi:two-component system, NtrC family, sensor kinase
MHSEKMAKVGLLVPDIAEEIANPLSFIIDNLNSLDTYCEHISELLEQKNTAIYSPQHPGLLRTPAVRKITKFKKQINFNFIKTDINSLLVILWKGSVGCKNWLKI